MKLRRTMSALMAGVMAVSSAVVCSVSASAEALLNQQVTVNSGTLDGNGDITQSLSLWTANKNVDDYESVTITYDIVDKGNINHFQLYAKGGNINWASNGEWGVTVGNDKTLTLDLSSHAGKTFNEIGYQINAGEDNANAEMTGKIIIKSLELTPKSGDDDSGDNQPTTKKDYFTNYDGKPITMTADGNGGATATFNITLDGITPGKSTIADLKAAYSKFGMNGIKYVKDSLGLSASNFGASVLVQAGDNWQHWIAQGYASLTTDGTNVTFDTSSVQVWDDTAKAMVDAPEDAIIQKIAVQIYVGDPKPDAVTALKKDDTFTINPTDTGDGDDGDDSGDAPATDGNVIWSGNTALGSWANPVSIKNPNLSAGDTVNIKYTVDDANAQLKVCAMTGNWDALASMTDTNEYGVADLAKDGTYSFVISEADAKAVNESGMSIQGQNATITEVSVTKAQSGGDEEPDDKDYEESTTDYTALTDYTLIKLAGGQTLFVMPISKADATENDTAVLKITRASDGKYVRCVTWKVYKGFKFIDANNTKLMESGKNGTYFVLFLLNNVDESENYTFELLLGNAKG